MKNDSLFGRIVSLPPEHKNYLHPDISDTSIRVKAKDKQSALIEVHLYTTNELNNNDSLFAVNVSSFNRADAYELNKKATNENHIMSVVGIAVGSFVLFTLVALATCNCLVGY
jgi:hypothetical protein